MKFIADGMLGKLARWLRLAGHDVAYIGDVKVPPDEQDAALTELARLEGRALLTSDLALHRRARKAGAKSMFIEGNDVVSQLAELSRKIGRRIEIAPENSRCPACNGSLKATGKSDVEGIVPINVLKAQREFWRCVKCGKVYWHGRHWKTIIAMASRYNQMVK